MFWSCADVDIVPRSDYRERCSGNGRLMVNNCRCNKGYYGERCQFANECEDDSQCGVFGKCVDVKATGYPKKLCYCRAGRFGPKCGTTSLVTNRKQVNLAALNKKILSDDLTLYWRVLQIEQELEVVLVNNGSSYAALGWRPAGMGKECKGYPYIAEDSLANSAWRPEDDDVLLVSSAAQPEPETEPEPEGEPEPHGEPEPKPEGEPEPESEPKSEPEPESEPKSEAEPESEPKSEPEPGSEPKSEPEPESEPKSEPEPESEPKSEPGPNGKGEPKPEPEPESEPKGEPEPTSEPEPEPHGKAKPDPEAGSEPKSEPEPEPEGEPGPPGGLLVPNRKKREAGSRQRRFAVPLLKEDAEPVKAEPEPEPEAESEPKAEGEPEPEPETASTSEAVTKKKTAFTPKGDFHAMDCTDIVVGVANGNHYRIDDFYTRDRSTPRPDSYWGGATSLTAALGWEVDGQTMILFRRKLEASEPTDHPITKGAMHVIWARGQEVGNYVHSPKSGLESGPASVQDFYRPGELKYHGKKESKEKTDSKGKEEVDWCGDHWRYPSSCKPGKDCEYYAKWKYNEQTDYITFLVQTSEKERWTGIGFTDNRRMSLTDAVIGWVELSGRYFMYDAWARGYTSPVVDPNQGIKNFSASIEDGITTLNFERKRVSGDAEYDLSFTDDQCLYMVFPIKGGIVNFVSKKIRKHTLTPIISPERICIRSCSKFGGADGRPFVYTTTPRPPRLHYEVEVKLTDVGNDFVVPERGSTAWNQLTNRMRDTVEGALTSVPGYLATEVTSVSPDGAGNLLTKMEVMIDEKNHLAEVGTLPELNSDGQVGENSMVRQILQQTIAGGAMGNLRVDPQYLRVSEIRETSSTSNTVTSLSGEEQNAALSFLAVNKNWVIVGIVAALVVLTIIQAAVTIARNKKSGSPPVSTKERLITNSGWRDYSGTQNYIYDTTEMRENGMNARRQGNAHTHTHTPQNGRQAPVRAQTALNGHHSIHTQPMTDTSRKLSQNPLIPSLAPLDTPKGIPKGILKVITLKVTRKVIPKVTVGLPQAPRM
ncbi:hypothetical protein O3P69_011719 [Scylla paramamosain]|uniref:Cell surface glycoprotein 1 n=1 Tax=Scylla paramamosain TaxID=85552 RepID=A0AAW0SCK3_SCYPA